MNGDGALYSAVGAVVVAVMGLLSNVVVYRRRRPDDDPTAALVEALAAESIARRAAEARANHAEIRCAECEAREQAREQHD